MRKIPSNRLTRFSDRVENYIKYRPGYPDEVLRFLTERAGLAPGSEVADVGSGTGIFSELLLKAGHSVYAIEPNQEMRVAAERLLARFDKFRSIAATAEATTLTTHSVDFITSAQAFHWFEVESARVEFRRVLRAGGKVALIWNSRRTDTSEFLIAYEDLLHVYATDYQQVRHQAVVEQGEMDRFFEGRSYLKFTCSNEQLFDFDGLRGRLLSSSYCPQPGDANHGELMEKLRHVFEKHQRQGKIRFEYETEVTVGELG